MNSNERTLRWENGILTFPCGVKVKISADKIKWLMEMFKHKNNGDELIKIGQTTIPKNVAGHLRSHLT